MRIKRILWFLVGFLAASLILTARAQSQNGSYLYMHMSEAVECKTKISLHSLQDGERTYLLYENFWVCGGDTYKIKNHIYQAEDGKTTFLVKSYDPQTETFVLQPLYSTQLRVTPVVAEAK